MGRTTPNRVTNSDAPRVTGFLTFFGDAEVINFADFLDGTPTGLVPYGGDSNRNTLRTLRYIPQRNYRVSPRLTFNLGLRMTRLWLMQRNMGLQTSIRPPAHTRRPGSAYQPRLQTMWRRASGRLGCHRPSEDCVPRSFGISIAGLCTGPCSKVTCHQSVSTSRARI